ncbi:MAG: hypothetical protein FD133_852 [Erysipelotrichaceae bacterium]|nr:MAG: hypothetical protein FD179_1585 [Erysipelotrichaceae bacterium]TXT18490.1 MAG: hypothetical protein FD133_852 [Erysipelotrichaceae bacterium]
MVNEKKSINGKKILLLAPSFFGYELKVKSKMEDMGALVDFYDERSVSSAAAKAILKFLPNLFIKRTNKYYDKILNENKGKKYDFIFVIKCEMLTGQILQRMKQDFEDAKFCLYLWDSISNIPGIESKFSYFDTILSFDRNDSNKFKRISFRPLFFLDEFRKDNDTNSLYEHKFDLCFLGTIHSDRYSIIKKLRKICNEHNVRFFTFQYLQSKFVYYVFKILKKEFRETRITDFSFEKMNLEDITNIVNNSKVILDIEHPKQNGLTMRTIEMIGMKKKIMTTNKDIANYDFYDPTNIQIISRENPDFSLDFFEREYQLLDADIYEKYYIENWITEILLSNEQVK